jgi:hypothetical protein
MDGRRLWSDGWVRSRLREKIGSDNVSASFTADTHYVGSATIPMTFKIGK